MPPQTAGATFLFVVVVAEVAAIILDVTTVVPDVLVVVMKVTAIIFAQVVAVTGDVGPLSRRTRGVAGSLIVPQFSSILGNIRLVVADVTDIPVPVYAVMIQVPLVVPQVAMILVKISPILIHIALTHSKQCSCNYENAQAETSTHVFPPRFGLQRLNP
jgi:hypothetical protein